MTEFVALTLYALTVLMQVFFIHVEVEDEQDAE
jgi:hypothetical protein